MATTVTDEYANAFYDYQSSKTGREQSNRDALSQATADLQGELSDIDVWAAEEGYKAGQNQEDRQWSALQSLANGRTVGGGSFNSVLGGRGTINLGGLSGGLSAANLNKLKSTKQADAQSDYNTAVQLQNATNTSAQTAERESLLSQLSESYSGRFDRNQLEQMLNGKPVLTSTVNGANKYEYFDSNGELRQYWDSEPAGQDTYQRWSW